MAEVGVRVALVLERGHLKMGVVGEVGAGVGM